MMVTLEGDDLTHSDAVIVLHAVCTVWLRPANSYLTCSSSSTLSDPLRERWYAVELPSTPAPTTTTSKSAAIIQRWFVTRLTPRSQIRHARIL